LLWLIISALFFAAGEFLSKKFAINPSWSYVFWVLVAYSLGALAWLPALLQRNNLAVVGAMWAVLSLMCTVLIGVMVFGEKINNANIFGVILAMLSLVMLSK